MNQTIDCPGCQRKLAVPENLMGHEVQCPSCAAKFVAGYGSNSGAGPPPLPSPSQSGRQWDAEPERDLRPRRPRYREYDEDDDYDDERHYRRRRRDLAPHRASTVLTLGILSLVVCAPILGPIAWVMGNTDVREMRAGRMDRDGESSTNAGRICGMIATCLFFGLLALYLLLAVFICGFGAVMFNVK